MLTKTATLGLTTYEQEISRLLTAAVVSTRYSKLLLSEPAKALNNGFNGEAFHFTREERERITSIRAQSLADFANQLTGKRPVQTYRPPAIVRLDNRALVPAGLD